MTFGRVFTISENFSQNTGQPVMNSLKLSIVLKMDANFFDVNIFI